MDKNKIIEACEVGAETKCPICNGVKERGKVTFTVDLGTNLVVIRDTPAIVCSLCGEEWISDDVAENIETLVKEAKMKNRMIEVLSYPLESVA
jgi:YgiT-type zinc finger domain-containing protein